MGSDGPFFKAVIVVAGLATIAGFVLALLAYLKPPLKEVIQVSPSPVQVQTVVVQPSPAEPAKIESAHATYYPREVIAVATPAPRVEVIESVPEVKPPVNNSNGTPFAAVAPPPKPVLSAFSSALLFATQIGDHDSVKRSLANGADPNVVSDDGKTPLIHAAENGHHDICKTLVFAGALIATTDNRGRNALHYAAEAGHNDIVQYLLDKGTPIDAIDNEGNTPLVLATRGAHNTCASVIGKALRETVR